MIQEETFYFVYAGVLPMTLCISLVFFILNLFFDDQHALMDICDDRFQRPPGALPSSMLGYEALTGSLDDFGFEDYLNSKKFYPLFSISQLPVVLHVHPSILQQPTTTLLVFLARFGERWYILCFLILIVGQQQQFLCSQENSLRQC